MTTLRNNRAGTPTVARDERRIRAREESLHCVKTPMPRLADFCIYTQFDLPFVKLPDLSKSIAKPLESNFWVFSQKKH